MNEEDKQLIDRLLARHDELLRNVDALARDNSRLRELLKGVGQGHPLGGNPTPVGSARRDRGGTLKPERVKMGRKRKQTA